MKKVLINCTTDREMMKHFPGMSIESLNRMKRDFKASGIKPSKEVIKYTVTKDIARAEARHRIKEVDRKYRELLERIEDITKERNAAIKMRDTRQTFTIEPHKKGEASESVAIIVCSDWHVEEIVQGKTVNYLN